MVGDGDAMRVPGQVLQQMFGSAERRLGVDHPLFVGERIEESAKRLLISQRLQIAGENELAGAEQALEAVKELGPEDLFSTGMGRRKFGLEGIQRVRSGEMPPPGTTQCTCG